MLFLLSRHPQIGAHEEYHNSLCWNQIKIRLDQQQSSHVQPHIQHNRSKKYYNCFISDTSDKPFSILAFAFAPQWQQIKLTLARQPRTRATTLQCRIVADYYTFSYWLKVINLNNLNLIYPLALVPRIRQFLCPCWPWLLQ